MKGDYEGVVDVQFIVYCNNLSPSDSYYAQVVSAWEDQVYTMHIYNQGGISESEE
jgi:hypothetical protein